MAPADWLASPVALREGLSVGVLRRPCPAASLVRVSGRGVVAAQRKPVDVPGRFLDGGGVERAVDHGERSGELLARFQVLPVGALIDGIALGLVHGLAVGVFSGRRLTVTHSPGVAVLSTAPLPAVEPSVYLGAEAKLVLHVAGL